MTESHPGSAGTDVPAQPPSTPPSYPLPLSQEALEAMPFPFAVYTCDGLCVGANALIEQLFQAPRSAVLGAFNLLNDLRKRNNGSHRIFEATVAGQHGQTPPIRTAVCFPGSRSTPQTGCWITVRYLPFRNAAGQVTHVGTITEEVTERVEAEREAAMLKALVENAGDGITVSDTAGTITFANPAFGVMSGYGPTLIGMHLGDIHPDERATLTAITPVIAEQGRWHGQLRTRRADGSSFPADVSAFLLRDPSGTLSGVAAIMRDLSDQMAHEQRLRRVEVMVENAPDGFSYTDLEGRLIYMNPAFLAMLGYREALVGAPLAQFLAGHEHARLPQLMQVFQSQGAWQGVLGYQRADGSVFNGYLTAFMVRDERGQPLALAGIMRDLTAQQRAEEERAALQAQVITAQQAALRELSTPLIPLADGVVALPLIGSIDRGRAQLIVETLLTGCAELRAHTAIIDITGVPVVDTQVANTLLQAAQAVKLLGAQVILTGIRPEVAQTLVGLGVDLSGISTRATLQSGIAEALGRHLDATPSHRW